MKANTNRKSAQSASLLGFTLLELLVVVSILSAVAFTSAFYMRNATEQAGDSLVRVEMQQIAQAIRRFKQDTGYYPNTGPFALEADNGEISKSGLGDFGAPSGDEDIWFHSPANLYQLVSTTSPLIGTGHQLEQWNPETGRGWNGPYMVGYEDGVLTIGDDINTELAKYIDEGNTITGVPAVADPFETAAQYLNGNLVLGWVTEVWVDDNRDGVRDSDEWHSADFEYKGSPYLVFSWTNQPYIVSMGPDGLLGSEADDDIFLELE